MAGLGDLLQRIARSLEEANAERPADDLRARLGYGTGDEDEDDEAQDTVREPEPEPSREPGTARTRPTRWKPETVWSPEAAPKPVRASAGSEASAALRAPAPVPPFARRRHAPAAPHRPASSASAFPERIRARLRTPDALREAFVVKEILDRPLGRRRSRNAR